MGIKNFSKTFTEEKNRKLLFLHGYLADSRSFNRQLSFFSRDFEVFAPDMKGFGENRGMEFPYSLDDYIAELKDYVYKNGLKSPHVVAHSFGARLVIKSAAVDKELFDKIVLTGAAGLKPRFSVKKKIKKSCFNFLKIFITKERLSRFYSKDYRALDNVMKESFIKIVSEYLDGYLEKIENKTLIVFGDKDKETPLYMAKRLNCGIKNSTVKIIKDAGHFSFIDKPMRFNTEVKEFLLS